MCHCGSMSTTKANANDCPGRMRSTSATPRTRTSLSPLLGAGGGSRSSGSCVFGCEVSGESGSLGGGLIGDGKLGLVGGGEIGLNGGRLGLDGKSCADADMPDM